MRDRRDELASMPAALRALAGIMLGTPGRDALLERVCAMAKTVLPNADDVSVTLVEQDAPSTAASSGQLAERGDAAQYSAGEGPCLDAVRTRRVVLVEDVSVETRWPGYTPQALKAGIRASVSVPLDADGSAGALNVYATRPRVFDQLGVEVATEVARYSAVVASATGEAQRAKTLAEQLQQALESRAVIEQAKGILMAEHLCTAEVAFERLVRLSQESHAKLRDIAVTLVEQTIRDPRD